MYRFVKQVINHGNVYMKENTLKQKEDKDINGHKTKSIGLIVLLLTVGIFFTFVLDTPAASAAAPDNAVIGGNQVAPNVIDAQANKPPLRNITTNKQRKDAAAKTAKVRKAAGINILTTNPNAVLTPDGTPDYFGIVPNYANSPLPTIDTNGNIVGGLRKFVDSLPGLGPAGKNNLGQYIPIAVSDPSACPGNDATKTDCYEIHLKEYTEKMHSDLLATKLRGYVQFKNGVQVGQPQYLGPIIVAQKDRPVRVKFVNELTTNGNLFLPVDTTIMGAGPFNINWNTTNPSQLLTSNNTGNFKQDRATLHLHGGNTPWISDGTQHQWITPKGESTTYPQGVSVSEVPDMTGCGAANDGCQTFYYTNQQSARLMFYHDHAYGITRLNVYAGEAAGYILQDPVEQDLINKSKIPDMGHTIPLIIQDKTFVPDNGAKGGQLANEDPTWNVTKYGGKGNLWFPHVYMPNQNPNPPDISLAGTNPVGRWDYSLWVWPFFMPVNGPIANKLYQPNPSLLNYSPSENNVNPGTPDARGTGPTIVPEAFMDTPIVNGNAYPNISVGQTAYRLRILDATNDRYLNLQLYYASTAGPFVVFSGGNGTGASALATVNATGSITGITITNGGAGYNSTPNVTIFDAPGHTGVTFNATATAIVDTNPANVTTFGTVTGVMVTTSGSGYSVPTICSGTANPANLCTEVSMVPATQATGVNFPQSWLVGGGTNLPPDIMDNRIGGIPNPASIGPDMIQIGNEGGFLPHPYVIPNRPVGYEKNTKSITITNVQEKALYLGPAERADIVVNFSAVPNGSTLILYNDAPAPMPAFDTRYDYYTGDVDQTLSGGAPETIPGYGPNTRTIMQIQVTGTSTPTEPTDLAILQSALPVAYGATQPAPIVPQADYNTAFGANFPNGYANIQDTNMTFTPAGATSPVTINFGMKGIVEDFDLDYGRMNAMLGVEVNKNVNNLQQQTSIPYYDIDPVTEIINNSNGSNALIGTMADGTQIWKMTHNGVDTHAIHWHMFNVQLINRIGWDGTIKPPLPNEEGWKDTVLMNPLESIIIALRPIKPNVPWNLPNSIRPLDVTAVVGSATPLQFHNVDPANEPATVVNHLVNFGWEYVWHCHLLGHEENDMMRPMAFVDTPNAPNNLTANVTGNGNNQVANLKWTDNSTNEINWTIQRATNATGPWTTIATKPTTTGPMANLPVTYSDATVPRKTQSFYQVIATNIVGDTTVYAAPAIGYPDVSASSVASNSANVTTK